MKHFIIASLFSILNINAIFAFDSIVSLLDFEKEPSIDYYIKIFKENDFYVSNDTMWIGGTPKYERGFYIHPDGGSEFNVTLYHTPSSRQFYKAYIKVTADKKPFVSELMRFYTDIIKKYGLPDSAYFRPDDSYYMSSDKNVYFSVNLIGENDTTKIKQFIEQSKPFGVIWAKDRFYINLEVREEYSTRYFTDFFCSITDNETEKIYTEEIEKLEEDKLAKERKNSIITVVVLFVCGILFLFVAKRGYKNIKKEEEKRKSKQKAEDEKRAKKQKEIDIRHEEYKKQLIDKYGPITRIISNNLYNDDFIMNYDEIFVFEKPKKIIIDKKELDFCDILSCSLYDENRKDVPPTQVTRTNTGSMLGRAAVGGLTLGVAGAVVGAITAKTESTSSTANSNYIASYVVKVGVKSIEKPTMTLKYGSDKSKAEEVYALMQAIIAMK
jgi:hypothetical protein